MQNQIPTSLLHSIHFQKDEVAFSQLLSLITPKVTAICRGFRFNDEDTQDIFQNVAEKIWTKIHQFKAEKGNPEAWIHTIIYNSCCKLVREREKRKEYLVDSDNDFLFDLHYNTELYLEEQDLDYERKKSQIQQGIEKLKKGQKQVLTLYYLENYSHQEVASILNITESTSKSQLCRAKQNIRKLVSN